MQLCILRPRVVVIPEILALPNSLRLHVRGVTEVSERCTAKNIAGNHYTAQMPVKLGHFLHFEGSNLFSSTLP